AGLWPQVFRGGPFGVWGTPPPKPLNCKVWENLNGAHATLPAVQALVFPRPKSVACPFVIFTNKKPCLLFGKQGLENLCSIVYPLTSSLSGLIVVAWTSYP